MTGIVICTEFGHYWVMLLLIANDNDYIFTKEFFLKKTKIESLFRPIFQSIFSTMANAALVKTIVCYIRLICKHYEFPIFKFVPDISTRQQYFNSNKVYCLIRCRIIKLIRG